MIEREFAGKVCRFDLIAPVVLSGIQADLEKVSRAVNIGGGPPPIRSPLIEAADELEQVTSAAVAAPTRLGLF